MDLPDLLYEKPALPAEETFDRFVKNLEGQKISDFLPGVPKFENADYIFSNDNVSPESQTLQTDFGASDLFRYKHIQLVKKYLSEGRMNLCSIFHRNQSSRVR
ncbi:hypothetical protein QUB10_29625 [Microcoleus sp. B5-D4]|uniref:hypothetical protein n=1 Tax=unclassified Microcoleus TaxID=2642155 RepID=UPI002FD58857